MDMQMEQAVIGAALIDYSSEAREAIEMLTPDAFTDIKLKAAFTAIKALDNGLEVVDLLTVSDLAEKTTENCLGYLAEIAKNTVSAANIKAYAIRLRKLHGSRVARQKMNEASQQIDVGNTTRATELISQALTAVDAGNSSLRWEYSDVLAKREVDRMERAMSNPEEENGYITNIAGIDAALGRVNRSDLILIAARPGMGKTELAITIADAYATNQDRASLFLTMEMENQQLARRQIALGGNMPANLMITPLDMESEHWAQAFEGIKRLTGKKLGYCDTANLSLEQVKSISRKFALRHKRLGAIFIDYIGLMDIPDGPQRHVAIGNISGGLKGLSKELKMPIFLLCQLNRELEKRVNKRPINSDLRESGALEQDADRILFPYRDLVYNEHSKWKNYVEIGNGKNRHEACKTGYMKFINGHFYDLHDHDLGKVDALISNKKQQNDDNF